MSKPSLRLIGKRGEIAVSINSTSWHVLDEPDLFPEGIKLREAFGVTWASGLFREPPFGILRSCPGVDFQHACEMVWASLLRDKELLSYSYLYEFGREKGVRHAGGMGGGFHIRGFVGSIKATPKGYCTLRLRASLPDANGRYPFVEILDLRKIRRIETDDAGYLKVHRRSMTVDWYGEMPRILDFCRLNNDERIEVRLAED